MNAEEQEKVITDSETNAIQNMINEGGLGADFYYINENADK